MKSLRATPSIDVLGLVFILVWSSGYVVGALATQVIAPLTVTLWRFAVAAVVLAVIATVRHERWPRGREFWTFLGIGVPMFAVQFGALYTAMAGGLPASTTSLIACSSPLLVAAASSAAGWEKLNPLQWLGILLGVAGVAVTLADRVGRPPSLAVLFWGLLGLVGLALGTVLQGRVQPQAGPAALASVELLAGFVVLAGWAPWEGSLAIPFTAQALLSFAWLALIAGVGAPLLLFALIRQRGATRASSYLFVVPAVTAIAAWPILGSRIGALTLVGLIIVAVALRLARPRPSTRPFSELDNPLAQQKSRSAAAVDDIDGGRPTAAARLGS